MEKKRVIVTGGGASGLMAAIAAAENGAASVPWKNCRSPGDRSGAKGSTSGSVRCGGICKGA